MNKAARKIKAMLTYRRPHLSKSESEFIARYISPFNPIVDGSGNQHIVIGESQVLWSCHIDTVHRHGGRQRVVRNNGKLSVHPADLKSKQSNCLGADDGAGVFVMLEMVKAKIPGHYIFHRGEERGGIGSNWLAKNQPKLLDDYSFAIAFDRRANGSVITHQGSRTCSDAFADSLSYAIGLDHRRDDGGTFTDTAVYTDLIGECSNVSVGYMAEHSAAESLDIDYLLTLADAMCSFDESHLVAERQPGEVEPWEYWDSRLVYGGAIASYSAVTESSSVWNLVALCSDYPDIAARILSDMGYTAADVVEIIHHETGVFPH